MLAADLASDFDSLCSSWHLACDFSSLCSLQCLYCCYVTMLQLASYLAMCCRIANLTDPIRSDFVQEPVRHLGHMATKICSMCKLKWARSGYHGSQWAKRDNRMCMRCVNRRDDETTAAAPGIPVSLPEGQHGAHTSAAAAGAGAVGESGAASPLSPVAWQETAHLSIYPSGTLWDETPVVQTPVPEGGRMEVPVGASSVVTQRVIRRLPGTQNHAGAQHKMMFSSDSASDTGDSPATRGDGGSIGGGGMRPGCSGGSVSSAVPGSRARCCPYDRPVIFLHACMYIYIHVL